MIVVVDACITSSQLAVISNYFSFLAPSDRWATGGPAPADQIATPIPEALYEHSALSILEKQEIGCLDQERKQIYIRNSRQELRRLTPEQCWHQILLLVWYQEQSSSLSSHYQDAQRARLYTELYECLQYLMEMVSLDHASI